MSLVTILQSNRKWMKPFTMLQCWEASTVNLIRQLKAVNSVGVTKNGLEAEFIAFVLLLLSSPQTFVTFHQHSPL